MADGDGAAIDVEFGLVEAEFFDAGEDLGAEGFVDFDAGDLAKAHAGGFEHGADGWRGADAHDLGRHADCGGGEDAGLGGEAVGLCIGRGGDEDGPCPIDDGRGIAASLDAAEGGAELGEDFVGGWADVAIHVHRLDAAWEFDTATVQVFGFERFGDDGGDFFGESIACGDGALEAAGGVAVYAFAVDAVLFGEVFSRVAHRHAAGGVVEGFPEEVLELDLAHDKAVAVRVGGDGVAAHRLGAGGEREGGAAERDRVGGLGDDFEAGATDALDEVRRRVLRGAGIEADVARGHVGIERGLGHGAGDRGFDVGGSDAGAFDGGAGGFDAEVDGRDVRECPAIIDEGGAGAAQEPGIFEIEAQSLAHCHFPLRGKSRIPAGTGSV